VSEKRTMSNSVDPVPPELKALLSTLEEVEPNALTSCPGWTAQSLAAHICGNYEEVRHHVEARAQDVR
jgi:hypothetical protein